MGRQAPLMVPMMLLLLGLGPARGLRVRAPPVQEEYAWAEKQGKDPKWAQALFKQPLISAWKNTYNFIETAASTPGVMPAAKKLSEMVTPKCREEFALKELVERTKWCDPKKAPGGVPPPKKLQGLFWLDGLHEANDLPVRDVVFCVSTGRWDPATNTFVVSIDKDFGYYQTELGAMDIGASYMLGGELHAACADDAAGLTSCSFKPTGKTPLAQISGRTLDWSMYMAMDEQPVSQPGSKAGDEWMRVTRLRTNLNDLMPTSLLEAGSQGAKHKYRMRRILDGDMNVHQENLREMLRKEGPDTHMTHFCG